MGNCSVKDGWWSTILHSLKYMCLFSHYPSVLHKVLVLLYSHEAVCVYTCVSYTDVCQTLLGLKNTFSSCNVNQIWQ